MNSPLPTVAEICAKAAAVKFGKPLVVNVDRGFVVELIVGEALGSEWRWLARDYNGWDFEHQAGCCRLEVKHSPARQTWATCKASAPSFDIKARNGIGTTPAQPGSPRRGPRPDLRLRAPPGHRRQR